MRAWSIVPVALSAGLFAAGVLAFFNRSNGQRSTKRLLTLTLFTVLAIVFLKLGEDLARNAVQFPSGILIETMQSFSMDADYSELLEPVPGTYGIWSSALIWYKVILYSIAPIVGGAVIYDVLAGISPKLRLLALRRKKMLIFSELNERTILLAKNLVKEKPSESFAVVFTDCCPNGGEESSELVVEAKAQRAICLQEDILHCTDFRKSAHCRFFLMDQNDAGELDDQSNLITLEGLLKGEPVRWNEKKGCSITLLTDRSETVENVRALKNACEKRRYNTNVSVVRDLALACCLHLQEEPLYQDLEKEGQVLDVVLFGQTAFAREMFFSIFWCGQILDHPLRITVVTPPEKDAEGEAAFLSVLRRFNPELLQSCETDDACLRLYPGEELYSPVYASLCFVQEDPAAVPMRELLTRERVCQYGSKEPFRLCEAQRFLVMGGSDGKNVALADELRRALSYLRTTGLAGGEKTIAAVVESKEAQSVVEQRFQAYDEQDEHGKWLKMRLFGSLEDRCCGESGFFEERDPETAEKWRKRSETEHELKNIRQTKDDIYNEWSVAARSVHEIYKMFSAGVVVQNGKIALADKLAYSKKLMASLESDPELVDRLRWLEHRRWCAFLRAQGFSQPPRLYEMIRLRQEAERPDGGQKRGQLQRMDLSALWPYTHKNIPNRLHPSLVECDTDPESKDMLFYISELREYVKKRRQSREKDGGERAKAETEKSGKADAARERIAAPKALPGKEKLGIKYYDSPYGKYGSQVSREELESLLASGQLSAPCRDHENSVLDAFEDCRIEPESSVYSLDLVLCKLYGGPGSDAAEPTDREEEELANKEQSDS